MKRLNLNNAIATTAMMTKTKTMKNKMNLFAKVAMMVAMMGMLLPQVAWGQAIDKTRWENSNGSWYILNASGGTTDGFRDDNYSISFPTNVSQFDVTYYFKSKGGDRYVYPYVKYNNKKIIEMSFGGGGTDTKTKQQQKQQNVNSITAGWTSNGLVGNIKGKSYTITIPLPPHFDPIKNSSYVFTNAGTNGTINFGQIGYGDEGIQAIQISQLFRSFLTSSNGGNIKFQIVLDQEVEAGTFYFDGNYTEIEVCGANVAYQNITNSNTPDISTNIRFSPKSIGTTPKSATVKVIADRNEIGHFTLVGTGKLGTQVITWDLGDDKYINVGDSRKLNATSNDLTANITYTEVGTLPNGVTLQNVNGEWFLKIAPGTTIASGTKIKIKAQSGATALYGAAADETREFEVTNLSRQTITWGDGLDDLTTLYVNNVNDYITFSATSTSGQTVEFYINNTKLTNNRYQVTQTCDIQVTAKAPATQTYLKVEDTRTFHVIVRSQRCNNQNIVNQTQRVTSERTFNFNGKIPETLTWNAEATRNPYYYTVKFTITDNNSRTLLNNTSLNEDNPSSGTIPLSGNETSIKVSFQNSQLNSLTVTQKTGLTVALPTGTTNYTIDFGSILIGQEGQNEITLSYSNVPYIDMTKSGDPEFTYEKTVLSGTEGCDCHGETKYTLKFTPQDKTLKTCTLTFQAYILNNDTPQTITIYLQGRGTKNDPKLTKDNSKNLPSGMDALYTEITGKISLSGYAEVDNTVQEVKYKTSDNTIAEVINGELQIKKAGTFTLTAYVEETTAYNYKELDLETYTVSLAQPSITPAISCGTENAFVFGEYKLTATSDDIGNTQKHSDGTISFVRPNDNIAELVTKTDGTYIHFLDRGTDDGTDVTITVNITASSDGVFDKGSTTLTVKAKKVSPSISWTDPGLANPVANSTVSFTLGEMQKGTNDPDISSWDESIKIVYSTSDNEFAEVINNSQINFKKHGQVTIKANIPAGNNNIAATEVTHDLEIACAPQSISWTPAATEYKVGNTITLDASSPANNITYSTSNANIVSTDGVCHKAGYVQITASSADNGTFCAAEDVAKNFKVDFEEGKTLNCQPNINVGAKKEYSFPLTGSNGIMVKTGSLTVTESAGQDAAGEFEINIEGDDLKVTYIPQNDGTDEVGLVITDDMGATGITPQEYHLKISATATNPSLDFGNITIGHASEVKTLDLSGMTNPTISSDANIRIVNADNSEQSLPQQVSAGTVRLKYYPTSISENKVITVTDNGKTYTIPFTATVSSETLEFTEPVNAGAASSETKQFTLSNMVSHSGTGFEVSTGAEGQSTAFSLSTDENGPFVRYVDGQNAMAVTDGGTIYVKFTPLGADYSSGNGELKIKDGNTIYTVNIKGTTETYTISFDDVDVLNSETEIVDLGIATENTTITTPNVNVFRIYKEGDEWSTDNSSLTFVIGEQVRFAVQFCPNDTWRGNSDTKAITESLTVTSSVSIAVNMTGNGKKREFDFGTTTRGLISTENISMTAGNGYTLSSASADNARVFRKNGEIDQTLTLNSNYFSLSFMPNSDVQSYTDNITVTETATEIVNTIYVSGTSQMTNLQFNSPASPLPVSDYGATLNIVLNGWQANRYDLDIIGNDNLSYASSFIINGVAGTATLSSKAENQTIQFRPKKLINNKGLALYAIDKVNSERYKIANIDASSTQKEVTIVWNDQSDPIMIGMDGCSYGFASVAGVPELTVYYSSNATNNIENCGDGTTGTRQGVEGTHYAGLIGKTLGGQALIEAYILETPEYRTPNGASYTKTFEVTDKLQQDIICLYDTIVVTNNYSFNVSELGAYAVDMTTRARTGQGITYTYNENPVTDISYNNVQDNDKLVITAAGDETYLQGRKEVVIRKITEQNCGNVLHTFEKISIQNGETSNPPDWSNISSYPVPVGSIDNFKYSIKGISYLLTGKSSSFNIIIHYSDNSEKSIGNSTYGESTNNDASFVESDFTKTISYVRITASAAEKSSWESSSYVNTDKDINVYQKRYFNSDNCSTSIAFTETPEQYSQSSVLTVPVANYSALKGIIRYKITGADAASFKVVGTKTSTGKKFETIPCMDFGTASVMIQFTPQKVGLCEANLVLYANIGNTTDETITIPLSGTGEQRTQTISWGQEERLKTLQYADFIGKTDAEREIELTAYSNIRGQEITYVFLNEDGTEMTSGTPGFVELTDDGKHIKVNGAGTVKLRAKQGGTAEIKAATPVDLDITVAKADPKLKWDEEYNDDWMYVFGTETIAAHSEPIEGNTTIGSTGKITYSTTTTDLADCTEGSLKVKKYGEVTIKAVIAEDDNYLGGEKYAITNKFNPKKVTPVINWAEESLGDYKAGTTVTLANDLAATISKSTDEEPDVTLWSDDIAIVYSSQNTQIATVSGNVVSLNGGKKGVVTIQADVPVGANGNNIAAEPKTRTMKVDFAASDIRDCGTAAVLQSCSTQPVNLSDEIITASNSSFSYIRSSNKEFTGSISNGVLTVTFTPTSVKEPATQTAEITIKDDSNEEEYHINVKGTATLHPGSISSNTTAGHWTFQANAGTKTLTIASNGDIWGDQDEMNGAITLSSDKEDNVTVSGNTITIVGGDADTDDDVTVTLTASFPGSDRIAACSTDITLTIQKLASGLALNKAELNNNAYVYSTIAMLADGLVSDGDLNIKVTSASTHEVSEDNKITLKSCVATTITATKVGTTIYKSGSDNVTFTPKKVTPVVTWNGNDFTTDLSNSEFTLTDAATVTAADGQPDVSVWDEEAKTIVYSSMTPNVATLKSGETNTFELHKVGYATIQAQVNANDNINLSNPPAERHLKVDFNPNYFVDFGTVGVYSTSKNDFELSAIEADGRGLIAAKSIDNDVDFTYGNVVNDKLPITFKPQSHDEDNPTKSTIVTIHDYGNSQDYHLAIKGTTALAQPSLKYDSQKHDGWEFVVQLPNTATEVIYGGSSYDIQWNNFPNPDLKDSELVRMVLSLNNPVCSTYVDIIDHSHFVVKQANEGDDNSIVDVVLVATYPGIENQIAGTSIEIPIKIKKNQYSLNWNKTDGFSIEVYQHSLPLAAPTQTPEGGESVIEYSFSEEGIGTYDGSTFTLIGPPYKSGKLTASIASDKYAVGTSAELDIKVKKTEQTVTWAGDEITNGFTTQKSTTEGIQLTAEAFRGSTKTNANIRYEVTENSNCSGEGDLIRLDVNKGEKPWITTLYYTGNGSGTVSIKAIAEETDEYNESKADDPSASPIVTFGIIREGCNVNSWTVADMHYGDKVTLAPAVDKFTKGSDYEYTLPTVTGTLNTAGNVLDVKGVGNGLTISAKKLEDCWVTESADKVSNTFNISKSEQKIEWSQLDISAAAIGDVEHQLAVPVAKDKLHTIGEGTWLTTLETGLDVTYNIDQTAATKCSTDDVVVIEDGKLKITGRGSGTVTITAQQTSGSEYYNPTNATDEKKSITVNITKVTPTIEIGGAPTGNVTFGAAPMTITAQAMLNRNVVKDYQDIELYTLANNKIVLTTSDPTTVSVTENNTLNFLKSGSATITATIKADCIVENKVETTFTVTVDRAAQLLKWESWPAGETKSITTCDETFEIALDATTTDVNENPTGENNVSYEIVSTNGNCNTALVKIEDNKLTYLDAGSGSVEIKAVVAQSDKYSAIADGESMHRTFVINRCSTDVIVWDGTELNNVHYNDVIVPNADFSELSEKASDKGSISYSVKSGPLNNEFKATGVGAAEITATTGANCYSTGATMTKSFTIQPTTQEIVWTGTELNGLTTGQYANGGKVIDLTAKSYDAGADHNHEETGLDIHYEISDISGESGCENFVMLDPNDNHKLIVTGTGAGTFKITASQKGKDGVEASGKDLYYEAATDVTIDVTISKITPTISFAPQNSMNYGDKVAVTASSALEGLYSSDADVNNGITITSASNDAVSISEGFMEAHGVTSETGVTLTASQADNCVVSGVNPVSENVIVTLGQQQMVWNGKSTASINVAGTQTFTFNPYAIDKLHKDENGTWLTLTNGEFKTGNTVEYVIGDVTRCESSTEADLVSVDENGVIRATGKGTGTVRIWAKAKDDSRYAEITADEDKVYVDVTVNGVKPEIQSFDISSLNSIHYGDRVKLSSPKTNYFVNQGDNKTTFSYADNAAYGISAIGTDTMFDAKAVGTGYTITATQEAIACFNQESDPYTSGTFNIAKSEQEIEWNNQTTLSIDGVSNDYQTDGISLTAKAMDKRHKAGGSQTWLTNLETELAVTYTFADGKVEKCADDADIISIDENGKLTATGLGSGTVTITATQADGNGNYSGITADEDKKSITVTVNKITPDLKIYGTEGSSLNGATLSVYYGDPEYTALACKVMFAGTNNELKNASGNTLYSIGDIELTDDGQGVVTIGDNGISFNKEGVATITATLKADCRVSQDVTATFYVNVQKPAQEIKFEQDIENQTTLNYHDVALTAYSYDKVHNRKIEDLTVRYAISTSDGCGEIATYSDNTVHVTGLGAGTVTITASQAGDDRYGAAQDVPRTFTIAKVTPTVDFTIAKVNGVDYSDKTVIHYNDVLTLAGTSTVEGTTYDGHEHVTFKYNDGPISSNQVTVTDQQFTLQAVQAEDCIVIGGQSEVKNYSISNTPTEIRWTQTIAADQTTTSPMQPLTLTAEVWDTQHNVKIDDATVTFSISGNTTTGCGDIATLTENLLTVTGNGAGTVTLTASYSGENGKYNAANSVEQSFTITKADPQFNWAVAGDLNATYGDNNVTATATHYGTGTVTYSSSKEDVATIDKDGNITIEGAGTTTLSATLAADCKYEAVTTAITKTLTVAKATQTIDWDHTFGDDIDVMTELSFTASSNIFDDGIYYTADPVGILGIDNQGHVKIYEKDLVQILKSGTVNVTAHHPGNENYEPAESETKQIVIHKHKPTVVWNPDPTRTYEALTTTSLNAETDGPYKYGDITIGYEIVSTSPDGCASINENTVTFNSQGTVVVRAKTIPNKEERYEEGSVEATLTITPSRQGHTITWNQSPTEDINYKTQLTFLATSEKVTDNPACDWYEVVTETGDDSGVFGVGNDGHIIIDNDGYVQITGAGKAHVKAHHPGNSVYAAAYSKVQEIVVGKASPELNWTTAPTSIVYKGTLDLKQSYTAVVDNTFDGTYSFSSNETSIITVDNSGNVTAVGNAGSSATVTVTMSGAKNYSDAYINTTITIKKGTPDLAWNESFDFSSLTNKVDDFDLTGAATCSNVGNITYSVEGNENVSVSEGHKLKIDYDGTNGVTFTLKATVSGGDNYNDETISKVIEVTNISPIEIIVQEGTLDLGTTNPQVTSVSKDVDFLQLLTNSNAISCNYNNVTYSFASSNNNIAKFNTDKTITANKVATGLQITVTASVTDLTDVSETLYVNIPRGTMVFNREGNWDDMLSDGSNWHRRDLIPTKVDHNVSIAANCTVNDVTTTAECWDMEIADNGMLTISTDGILNVAHTLSNSDASKLVIAADADGQGTLIFHNETNMPQATVEMWCKGSETGTGADGGDINPNWQYRGIAVSLATLTENAPDLIYQWTEAAHASDAGTGITEQWTKVTGNQMSAWNGYAVAKYTDAEGHGYKTSAIGYLTNANQVISLAYTANQTPEGQTPEGVQSGFNLITNSFTAPLNYSKLVYDDGIQQGVVLFNTGKYVDWKNSGQDVKDEISAAGPGQYLFLPKNTGSEIASDVIPSGESFFVVTSAANKSITIPYSAVEQQVNGALRMPERREVYGKLIIEVDGGEGADRLYLLENENRIRGFENGYDGPKYAGTKGNPMLYATTDDGRMCVSADSSLLGQYIGFAAGKHDVTYTMTFDASALSGYSELYLYDTREKRYTNILDGGTYTFKGLVSGEDRRFKIVGSREDGKSVTGDDQTIIVTGNRFHVTGYDNADERIYLVDMTGKILWETSTAFGPWFDIPTDIPAGVYVIKTGNHTAKMAVK